MDEITQTESVRNRVLASIETQGLSPKPRWHFLLREGVVWMVVAGAFIVGTIASALSIYIMHASQFMIETIQYSDIDVLFDAVPFLWIALFGIAVFYAVHALRETRRGYQYRTAWLVSGALVASVGVGYLLNLQGFSAMLDRYLLTEAPLYRPISGFRPHPWMRAEAGLLAGRVLTVEGDQFTVRTIEGDEWRVIKGTTTMMTPPCPSGNPELVEGMQVRILGTSTKAGMYHMYSVCEFRGRGGSPLRGMRKMQITVEQ
jgi:hypothetical protein